MSVSKALDKAIKALDEDKKLDAYKVKYNAIERKTGRRLNGKERVTIGTSMLYAVSSLKSEWKLHGWDIEIVSVSEPTKSEKEYALKNVRYIPPTKG